MVSLTNQYKRKSGYLLLLLLFSSLFPVVLHAQEEKSGMNALDYKFFDFKKKKSLETPYRYLLLETGFGSVMKAHPEHDSPFYMNGLNLALGYEHWLDKTSAFHTGIRSLLGRDAYFEKRERAPMKYVGVQVDYLYCITRRGMADKRGNVITFVGVETGYATSKHFSRITPAASLGLRLNKRMAERLDLSLNLRYACFIKTFDGRSSSRLFDPLFSVGGALGFRL